MARDDDRTGRRPRWRDLMPFPRPGEFKLPDFQRLARELPLIARQGQRLFEIQYQRLARGELLDLNGVKRMAAPFVELTRSWMRDPRVLMNAQVGWMRAHTDLLFATWQRALGASVEPVIEPSAGDKRFRDPAWDENLVFDFIKQSYLLVGRAMEESSAATGLPPETARKLAFYTRVFVDAMAPTNFAALNPEVLRDTAETGGLNLVTGLRHMLDDLVENQGQVRVSITDRTAFEFGENLATTPGQVVAQTELMQLIQYQPSTPEVHRTPLLMVPPWINKYYVLDLRPENSFVKWCVSQGFTVFMVSWVNPDASLSHKRFDDYLEEGVLAALDAVEAATGEHRVNVLAYCIGGILMGSALAYMAAHGDDRVASASFLTTLLDFSEVGDIDVFINEDDLAYVEQVMEEKGYFEAERMADSFSMIRANDLIWGAMIRNYLLGKEPTPFDMLFWATDNTRMPASMHSFYLRNYYLHNRLREPGGIRLLDTPLDLSEVRTPNFFLSTQRDHIAPWQSTYRGAALLGGPTTFVLAGSGHIAGVVNPAGSGKYGHFTNAENPADPEDWLRGAQAHDGSWWPVWRDWLAERSGPMVPARNPGDGELEPIEDAPGSYALTP